MYTKIHLWSYYTNSLQTTQRGPKVVQIPVQLSVCFLPVAVVFRGLPALPSSLVSTVRAHASVAGTARVKGYRSPSNTWPHNHSSSDNCFSRCRTSPWESEQVKLFLAVRETRLSLSPHHRAVAPTPPLHPGNWAQQTGAAGGPQEQTGAPLNLGTHGRVSKPYPFRIAVAYKLPQSWFTCSPVLFSSWALRMGWGIGFSPSSWRGRWGGTG